MFAWLLLVVVGALGQDLLDCECRGVSQRIRQYETELTPESGKWFVQLETCSSKPRAGVYETREDALSDVPRLQTEIDYCIERLTQDDEPSYALLREQLDVAKDKISELEHSLAQVKADNELLVEQYGIEEFQERINEYLQHALGTDDFLSASDR